MLDELQDLGGGALDPENGSSALALHDEAGGFVSAKQYDGGGIELAVAPDGDLLVVGGFSGEAPIDGAALVAKADGLWKWALAGA